MNTENESRKLEAGDQLGPLQMDNPGGHGLAPLQQGPAANPVTVTCSID